MGEELDTFLTLIITKCKDSFDSGIGIIEHKKKVEKG
jgi:hypothetical protein